MRKKLLVVLFFLLLISIPSVNARQVNPTPIAYGQTVTGQSTDFNTMHFYMFSGSAGDTVVITASSPGDSFLQLGDANAALLAENDDISAEVLDSRIEYVLPASGQYLIGVTTYRPAEYTLTLTGPGGAAVQTGGAGTLDSPIAISYGQVLSGQTVDINTYTFYRFQGSAGDQIVAEALSDTVDTYLQFGDANAALLAENDDVDANNLNSRIEYTLSTSGSYLLAVSGYTAGPYQITVNLASGSTTAQTTDQQINSSPIAYGASVQGAASTFNEPVIYDFQGNAGDVVQISAQSDAVDTYLILFDTAGNTLAENDDISGDNLNSLIETSLPANGVYYVAVTAYRPGPYTLTLTQVLADDGTGTDLVSDQGPIGDVAAGTIDNTTYALEYPVAGVQKGATITVDVRTTSGDLDTYAALFYGETLVAENDDRSQGITDSYIEYPNAQPGDYSVIVTRYGFETGQTTGNFEVAIHVSGGNVVLPPSNTGATNIPDPSASGYPTLTAATRASWTIMAYLGGDNNLEPALLNDINEFELAGGSSETVRVVAFMDRSNDYDSSNGNWGDVRVFEVGADVSGDHTFVEVPTLDSPELAALGELDSGYSENLAQFLIWGMQTYPADHYAVVLNDHGGAWTGIVTDDTSYSILTIPALQDAFRGALQAAGVPKFDVLINDACLMSSIEYYAGMAEFFDFVISSPEITLNPSFDMELLTNTLNSNPNVDPKELGRLLLDKYMADMQALSPDLYPILGGAVTDLRQFDVVLQAINNFTSVIATNPEAYGSLLGQARSNTYVYSFFLPEDQFGPATNIDLGDFMNEIVKISRDPQLTQAAQGVIDALSTVRLYSTAGGHLKNYSSFYNIYFPARSTDFAFDYFEQSPLLSWAELLRGYYGVVVPRSAVAAPAPGATPAPVMSLTSAPSITPKVTVTNVYPTVTSTAEPTIVAMEVVGRNIAQVKFTVDQVQPNGESIRLDESNVVIEKIIDGVVDYVNEWDSGVNEINFTWEVNLSMITDGSANNFEPVQYAVDGTASLAGRYQFPGSEAWQDVTIIFNNDGTAGRVIARDTSGSTAIADITLVAGGTFQAYRSKVTPDGRVIVEPGNLYTWPEGGISYFEAPAPSGSYKLGFLVEAFGGLTGFDATDVTVNNDAIDQTLRGYIDFDWGFKIVHPADWFDVSYFPNRDWLQTSNSESTEYIFVYPDYDATSADLEAIINRTAEKYNLNINSGFTPITVGGLPALEFTHNYTIESGTPFNGRAFAVYLDQLQLGLVFSAEVQEGLDYEYFYTLLTQETTFFDISAVLAQDVGVWATERYGDNIVFSAPKDWIYTEGDFWNFYSPDEWNEQGVVYRAAAYTAVEGTDATAVMKDLLANDIIPFSPNYQEVGRETYYGEKYTWETTLYRYDGDIGPVLGRINVMVLDGTAYALWFEAPEAEAADLTRNVFDVMLDGFTIEVEEPAETTG